MQHHDGDEVCTIWFVDQSLILSGCTSGSNNALYIFCHPSDFLFLCHTAERTAAASRMASALTHCITKGCNTNSGKAASPSSAQHAQRASQGVSAEAFADCVVIVACAESADDLPATLRRCFTHELPVDAPDAAARLQLIQVGVKSPAVRKYTRAFAGFLAVW